MAKRVLPLGELQVRNAKPRDKIYSLSDGGGMYLEVKPSGSKIWRMKFRQANGTLNRLTFGPYPEITLQVAREKRVGARRLLLEGIDPAKHRDEAKRAAVDKGIEHVRESRARMARQQGADLERAHSDEHDSSP